MGRGGEEPVSHSKVEPEGNVHLTGRTVEEEGRLKYLSISSELDDWAEAINSRSKGSATSGTAKADTEGGRRLKASATTLALPATWQMSVVNSEM